MVGACRIIPGAPIVQEELIPYTVSLTWSSASTFVKQTCHAQKVRGQRHFGTFSLSRKLNAAIKTGLEISASGCFTFR